MCCWIDLKNGQYESALNIYTYIEMLKIVDKWLIVDKDLSTVHYQCNGY